MTDPITVLELRGDRGGPWTARLVMFLRIVAAISMLKGLYHWSVVLGIGDSQFEAAATPMKAATIFFAVIDLVAAVGLWLAAAWGGVVWLTASISMAAVELLFPQIFGGRLWIAYAEILVILTYVALSFISGRERST